MSHLIRIYIVCQFSYFCLRTSLHAGGGGGGGGGGVEGGEEGGGRDLVIYIIYMGKTNQSVDQN